MARKRSKVAHDSSDYSEDESVVVTRPTIRRKKGALQELLNLPIDLLDEVCSSSSRGEMFPELTVNPRYSSIWIR